MPTIQTKALILMMGLTIATHSVAVAEGPASTTFPSQSKTGALRGQSVSPSTPSYGGTLVWGSSNPPTVMNPVFTSHSISMSLLSIMFNRLVRINAKGEIEPDLARYWDVSDDGLTYTFYLRDDVKFHDNAECTAEDVVFTYRQFMAPENDSPFRSHLK